MAIALSTLLLIPTLASGQRPGRPGDAPPNRPETADPNDSPRWGHSEHGTAYDEGPRQRPWLIKGIGSTPFPITSTNPEVQQWFDQGIALLHSFWYYEAERSFRWCLKLDPECAMAYWGLALATKRGERHDEFLEQAVDRKDKVPARERAFIEVSEKFAEARSKGGFGRADGEGDEEARNSEEAALVALDRLLMDYPKDVEAKSLYWLLTGRASRDRGAIRYGLEAVLDDILEIDPDHVGALHYRVHNWDGKEGHYAIESCMKLGKLGHGSGHLLHMPGHVLSGIGLWHEAAIAMDRATRVEKAYMNKRMIMPEDNWDYFHNLDYLCYIQEQLGMVDAALFSADQLLRAPFRNDGRGKSSPIPGGRGLRPLLKSAKVRTLVKFERWEEILDSDLIAEKDDGNPITGMLNSSARFRALLGLCRVEEAEDLLEKLRKPAKGPKGREQMPPEVQEKMKERREKQLKTFDALLHLAKGEHLAGLELLTAAATAQEKGWHNDPPREPTFLFNLLGDHYLKLGAPLLAAECYERTLKTVFEDGFALAGLVVAYHAIGEEKKANDAMSRLQVTWSEADRPNRWLEAAEATGVKGGPWRDSPMKQRNYRSEILDVHGPSLYERSEAPALAVRNAKGDPVSLEDYRGKNVILIFYLGEECVHCMEQIQAAEKQLKSLGKLDTVVLACSKDPVEEIADQQESLGLTLLSDPSFKTARAFQSYDDFEDIELHSTFILDRKGMVHWSSIGGEPYTNFTHLKSEITLLNADQGAEVANAESTEVPTTGNRGGTTETVGP